MIFYSRRIVYHNRIGSLMSQFNDDSFAKSLLGTVRLAMWTIPHWCQIEYFIEKQVPCFFSGIEREWISSHRKMQRVRGSLARNGYEKVIGFMQSRANELLEARAKKEPR